MARASRIAPTGWRPHWRNTRVQLPPEDNAALTRWQDQHLRVAWATHAQPWLVEPEVIATMHPPLNVAGNAANDFTATMAEARTRLRDAARAASQP